MTHKTAKNIFITSRAVDIITQSLLYRFRFRFILPQLACYFASGCRMSSKRDHLLRKCDVISIFPDGGRSRSILFPVSYLLMSLPSDGQIYQQTKFRQHQWSTYINLWLRYNEFWFGITNVHHIRILLPVLTLITSP